jgi:uncharacterized membrane protein AbrB (regulator of aidB expression)
MVGVILLVVLLMYCYRHVGSHNNTHAYMSSVPETAVRMSTLDNEVDDDINSLEEISK